MKLAVGAASVLLYLVALVPSARPYPPFVSQAKRLGFPVKDCTYCHVKPTGGEPYNQVGQWLVAERERRGAAAVDVKWLADYKPQPQGGGGRATRRGAASTTQSAGGTTRAGSAQPDFMQLNREWADAFVRRDTAALERILADDFIEITSSGMVVAKRQYIAEANNPELTLESINVDDGTVRLYGDTAVVTGQYTIRGRFGGQDIGGQHRYTAVYVRKQGRWQPVSFQATRIESQPSGQTSGAGETSLTASMTGGAEVPKPGDPAGTGSASFRLDPGQGRLCYTITVSNIAPPTAAHIHRGAAGQAGPPVVMLATPKAGGTTAEECVNVERALLEDIMRNPSGYYINVHNTSFPAGAVRGQLSR